MTDFLLNKSFSGKNRHVDCTFKKIFHLFKNIKETLDFKEINY